MSCNRPEESCVPVSRQLPSGLVTFLFTDIEGSTRLARELGGGYRKVLSEHRRLLRRTLAGTGFELFAEGDSIFFVFDDAGAALGACLAAQRALAAHEWPAKAAVPRVQMGLHTGHAEPVAGEYATLEVHRAARIASAAHGGQVLCSEATARHAGSLPSDASLVDLGLHRLRGFDDWVRLYQLVAAGLELVFPRPRTTGMVAHNLPRQVTSFVGRQPELAELTALVADHRLVTIVGSAGTGKTRLAVEVADSLVTSHPDGVWFVDLSSGGDPGSVAVAIAAALGLRPEPGRPVLDTVAAHVADRRTLVVLDGCNAQPSAVAPAIARLLSGGGTTRALVTGREPLGIPGEVAWTIPPLTAGPGSGGPSDAVSLLLDRIEAVRGGRRPDNDELPDLERVASLLDGSPELIESTSLRFGRLPAGRIAALLAGNDEGADPQEFVLFLGSYDEGAVSKLRASGVPYRTRILTARPETWDPIAAVLREHPVKFVVAELPSQVYGSLAEPANAEPARGLLGAMSAVPHVAFIHEAVLAGLANRLLDECGVNVMPYQTEAERSVLAAAFLDDNERHLLFRVYIPAGRLYAAEADRLLSLFRDWIGNVGGYFVRQDGYRTVAGQVYELFGDGALPREAVPGVFEDFSRFLDLCVESPELATQRLVQTGIDRLTVGQVVARYGKEVRRLHVDLRQARESRILALRHQLESELLDAAEPTTPAEIQVLLDRIIHSAMPSSFPRQVLMPAQPAPSVTVNVNQQVIGQIQGSLVQNFRGTVHLGPEPKQLLELIDRFGGDGVSDLESAVHEMEDPAARAADRLSARQRLKRFLLGLPSTVETSALAVLQKYVESKLGL
jgi:class 3 adenylate cyclase